MERRKPGQFVLLCLCWIVCVGIFALLALVSHHEEPAHINSQSTDSSSCSFAFDPTVMRAVVGITGSPQASLDDILISARAVVLNSDPRQLKALLIIDPTYQLSDYHPDVEALQAASPLYDVQIIQPPSPAMLGEASARSLMEKKMHEHSADDPVAYIFLDVSCVVRDGWLQPLLSSVSQDPSVVAVPGRTVDSLGSLQYGGTISWKLGVKPVYLHEPPTPSHARVPAMTGMAFAVHSGLWKFLEGYALSESLKIGTSVWPGQVSSSASLAHSVELSLRMWSCGAVIHANPCSSIAVQPLNQQQQQDSPSAAAAAAVKGSALHTAELWFGTRAPRAWMAAGVPRTTEALREHIDQTTASLIGQARVRLGRDKGCQSLDWYLQNVDSTLLSSPLPPEFPPAPEKKRVKFVSHRPEDPSLRRQRPPGSVTVSPVVRPQGGVKGLPDSFQARVKAAKLPLTSDTVDPKLLRRQAADPATDFPPVLASSHCGKRDRHSELLKQVQVDHSSAGSARIFCMVYSIKAKHQTAVKAVRDTWASKCDGFIAMSDLTDPSIPTLSVLHEGAEEYDNIWQKVRSIWLYVYMHYRSDYDYFMIGGDDMYVIVENLRRYLNSEEIVQASQSGKAPLFLGRRFAQNGNVDRMFNSGGAGYILNQESLRILAENALDNPLCSPHLHGFYEDVMVAMCLKKVAGITPYDTRDDQGRERFHPFTPGNHLDYKINHKNPDWYAKYSVDLKEGRECCSDHSASFHYVKGELMPRLHALLYDCRQ